jgi:hypothetical protein
MSDPLSRRTVISLIATLPLGITAMSRMASAADSDDSDGTKAQFKYQATAGPGGKACAACALFQAPSACAVVKGKIAPTGYCISFAAK